MIRIYTCDELGRTFCRGEIHVSLNVWSRIKLVDPFQLRSKNDLSGMLNLQPLVKRPGGIQSINQLIGEISCCGQLS
jgi:hypothetical protein